MIDERQCKHIIEATLLAASAPVDITQLQTILTDDDAPDRATIARLVADLQADCNDRGIELVEVANGFRYQIRTALHPWVARLWAERPTRYSRALLETLALIAYRQPVTRGDIEQVRGVAVSSNMVRTLEERGWIRIVGHRDTPGHPALFGTTREFLDYFNLRTLDELPPLAELAGLDRPSPQLSLIDDATSPDTPSSAKDRHDIGVAPNQPDATPVATDITQPDISDNPEENRA